MPARARPMERLASMPPFWQRGERHGRKRIAGLMREAGLVGAGRRRGGPITTRRNKEARPAPDLVDRDFSAMPHRLPGIPCNIHATRMAADVPSLFKALGPPVRDRIVADWRPAGMPTHRIDAKRVRGDGAPMIANRRSDRTEEGEGTCGRGGHVSGSSSSGRSC
jgi:hypothetical protein